jgi:hypothetical protein
MDDLANFYDLIRAGTRVDEFLRHFTALFPFIHANGLTAAYRLGKGRTKRLRDEVTPVATLIRHHAAPEDRIQFPLNSGVPDCNVWHANPARHRTVETTVIQARSRLNVMTELNNTGWGRGFLGVTDDAPTRDFEKAMNQEREAYSTEQVQTTTLHELALCAANKAHSQAHTLVIDVGTSMEALASSRWFAMRTALAEPVKNLSFSEIYLVGRSDEDLCLKLK